MSIDDDALTRAARIMGMAKTEKKAAAARVNGLLGGRPRKSGNMRPRRIGVLCAVDAEPCIECGASSTTTALYFEVLLRTFGRRNDVVLHGPVCEECLSGITEE